ncbi:NUDIX hydrolase [Streptomyces sp. NPDC044571]|uniref:NUDIX hydrolase n=1 Tax=Streptomyces sp. NPDC044571 TaxID=3155371 RepID=UPI0033FDFFC1
MHHRGRDTDHPDTWSLLGGARDSHESAAEAALREAVEESDFDPARVRVERTVRDDHGGWSYDTVIVSVDQRMPVRPVEGESLALSLGPALRGPGHQPAPRLRRELAEGPGRARFGAERRAVGTGGRAPRRSTGAARVPGHRRTRHRRRDAPPTVKASRAGNLSPSTTAPGRSTRSTSGPRTRRARCSTPTSAGRWAPALRCPTRPAPTPSTPTTCPASRLGSPRLSPEG